MIDLWVFIAKKLNITQEKLLNNLRVNSLSIRWVPNSIQSVLLYSICNKYSKLFSMSTGRYEKIIHPSHHQTLIRNSLSANNSYIIHRSIESCFINAQRAAIYVGYSYEAKQNQPIGTEPCTLGCTVWLRKCKRYASQGKMARKYINSLVMHCTTKYKLMLLCYLYVYWLLTIVKLFFFSIQ